MVAENLKLKTESHNLKGKADLRERSYSYAVKTIKFLSNLPENRVSWVLGNQLVRSATSIGANIIEAKSSSSKKDFIKFYEIALKSANETEYWLGLFRDALNINNANLTQLMTENLEISKMLAASLLTMKNKK